MLSFHPTGTQYITLQMLDVIITKNMYLTLKAVRDLAIYRIAREDVIDT